MSLEENPLEENQVLIYCTVTGINLQCLLPRQQQKDKDMRACTSCGKEHLVPKYQGELGTRTNHRPHCNPNLSEGYSTILRCQEPAPLK